MSTFAMVPVVMAHAGHVLLDLAIYLGPVVAIVLFLKASDWRDARRKRREGRH
jgi:hypothetical protein